MIDNTFRYSEEIDKKIPRAVEKALGLKTESIARFTKHGEYNHVYKVTTPKQVIVIRVFRSKGWPEKEKPLWVEEKLTEQRIPHAKILFYTRDSEIFPHGYIITEFLKGSNGWDAISSRETTFDDLHEKLAKLLHQIHSVKTEGFGLIKDGKGEFSLLSEFMMHRLREDYENLAKIKEFDIKLLKKIEKDASELFIRFDGKLQPCMTHGDPTPSNCIYTPEGEVFLVDWDGVMSKIWIADLAWITFWGSHLSEFGTREERRKRIHKAFRKVYKNLDISWDDVETIERQFHILQAVSLLPYYEFNQKNKDGVWYTLQRIKELVG